MRLAAVFVLICILVAGAVSPAAAQQGPSDAVKAMIGAWELSNADHDRTCTVNFKLATTTGGYQLELDKGCGEAFPAIRNVAAWTIGKNDMLVFVDAKGASVLELLEVEAGMFEGLRPNEGRYFLQNAAVAAAQKDKTADQMFGEWGFVRSGGRVICGITLENTAKDADSFALTVKTVCDPLIVRFGPVAWKMDRGQLIILSAKGDVWRFEEADSTTVPMWERVPAGRQPLRLVKQ